MTPLEIIALIAAILIVVKCLVWIARPKGFTKLAEKIFKKSGAIAVGYFILVLVIGYFVFQELSIIQIVAVLLMSTYLIKGIMSMYGKEMIPFVKKVYEARDWREWVIIVGLLIIAGIIAWGLFIK
jgi:hypothetical protein